MFRTILSLCVFGFAALHCRPASAQLYQGVSLSEVATVDTTLFNESLLDVRQIGANAVAIDLNWAQPTLNGNPDVSSIMATLEQVTPTIATARQRGLNVFLRSNIVVESGEFSGRVVPSSSAGWFANYGQILDAVADFATGIDVSMLSIGSNLQGLEAESFRSDWQSLIGRVRDRFDGVVTYSADIAGNEVTGGGYREVPWWNDLDVVGVNAFLPLSFDFNAIPQELDGNAMAIADDFEDWLASAQIDKQLIFTNTGYRSVDGGSVFPLERTGDRVDLEEQMLAYNAVLNAFGSRDWFGGSFWRGWSADPQAGGAGDTGFTPQNKPAETVLAQSFGGTPTFAVRPSLLESWEQGLNGWSLPNSGSSTGLSIEDGAGITDGERSLALLTGGATAAKLWTLNGSEAYTLLQEALADPTNYELRMDVSLDNAGTTDSTLQVSLMDDSERPNIVNVSVNFEATADGQARDAIQVPMTQFGDLNPFAIFYELHLSSEDSSNARVLIDNLRLVTNVEGDVTNDTIIGCDDMDAVSAAVRLGWTDNQFDLNEDGIVDGGDRAAWLASVGSLEGDFDLNGAVDFADFLLLSNNFGQPGNWCEGDTTGDREVNFADFLALSANFGSSVAATHSVPEPSISLWPLLLLMITARRRF